jgi:O-methyltransferase
MIVKFLNSVGKKFGYEVVKKQPDAIVDIQNDNAFMELYDKCKAYTMTSPERMYSLYKSVEYVLQNNLPGDFVECGVWQGGCSMMMALTLLKNGVSNRKIYMYDTFEGMSEPTEADKTFSGIDAKKLLDSQDRMDITSEWCYSKIDDVRAHIALTGYPLNNIMLVKGKVEDTIPGAIPEKIAILRLDTDWYESTWHELQHLYPLLVEKGILIIDDYGHWQGARKAVDTYFSSNKISILLNRIDYTGRIAIKH